MTLYPININIRDRLCVVVGGGRVAARKVVSLLGSGAVVKVISPRICPKIETLEQQQRLELVRRQYQSGDLTGACLVFAATDRAKVQQKILDEAGKRSLLINVADSPERCTFQIPASLKREDLLITVSTGGGSPLLAATIREELERRYGEEYGVLVRLLAALRVQLLELDLPGVNRKKVFKKLLSLNILGLMQTHHRDQLRALLEAELPEQVDINAVLDSRENNE